MTTANDLIVIDVENGIDVSTVKTQTGQRITIKPHTPGKKMDRQNETSDEGGHFQTTLVPK